jgi:hypothetical protein
MTVVPLTRSNEFWSLTPGREYVVIGVDHESYRVVDDKGDPILFPREGFRVVDDTIPQDWIWDRPSDDEYYGGPEGLQTPGFYEDYFDGKREAIEQFTQYLQRVGIVPRKTA